MRLIDADGISKEFRDYGFEGKYSGCTIGDLLDEQLTIEPTQQWIPCSERLPKMHDAGILKKIGVRKRSKHVFITIKDCGSEEAIVDADAELRDGEWYSDTLRWLKVSHKNVKVTAWMPYPEPYRKETHNDEP